MRNVAAIFALCAASVLIVPAARARPQALSSDADAAGAPTSLDTAVRASLRKGTWELGLFAGAGNGLGFRTNVHYALAGGRIGRVMIGEHLRGWARGNFELATEVMPVYEVFNERGDGIYGVSIKPIILRWNFTSGKKFAPYITLAGGLLFSTDNVPPGNTSWVNFTPQGALGLNIFRKPGQAIVVEGSFVHLSNASLGHLNPGYNASLVFTLGYSWFKHGDH